MPSSAKFRQRENIETLIRLDWIKKQTRHKLCAASAFHFKTKGAAFMVKIAVLVSGGGTNLQALIDRQQAGELGCGQISLVISSRAGVYALERAEKAGIESMVISRKRVRQCRKLDKSLFLN